ncbi:MAG: hypothetical protein M1816_005798 [Peltula sp. TS41687]|nr:MAG: hypothetical protein M1816_005798 [Peltula sp. TS41687]
MLATTFISLLSSLLLFVAVLGQSNVTSVNDVFPELAKIPTFSRSPRLGGQSFNRCCSLAVKESLSVVNGSVVVTNPSIISVNATTLRQAQFPCGAQYTHNHNGTLEVWVPYRWCASNCAGWEVSKSVDLNQWVVPVVGFIVPAVVFCLTIPRRLKLNVSDNLFNINLNNLCQIPMVPFLATAAGLLVSVDTVIWVAVAFALSGPMLLSGFYEGRLDQRLLGNLQQGIDYDRLDVRTRARILYIILVGNLDMGSSDDETDSAWKDVQDLVSELELAPNLPPTAIRAATEKTKVRLRAMLASQYSFGTMTGAPVIFYTASFVYTLVDIHNRLGDHNTSLSFGFGIWWMTIPHLSIIGACLLAGNNPKTLEGIVGRGAQPEPGEFNEDGAQVNGQPPEVNPQPPEVNPQPPEVNPGRGIRARLSRFTPRYVPVYQSIYQPATMWNRGKTKRGWINRLCKEVSGLERLKRDCKMHKRDWITVGGGAMFLTFIPSLLAFLQNYFTLRVGIGCRALTVLLYVIFQFLLILLWMWELNSHDERRTAILSGFTVRRVLVASCAIAAIFVAIGGTLMQVIGVYRTCICYLSIGDWIRKEPSVMVASNTRLQIQRARTTWLPLGSTATAFLGVVSYIGWWYQRHLRFQFRTLVNNLDATTQPTQPILEGEPGEELQNLVNNV